MNVRRVLIAVVTFLGGVYFFGKFFLPGGGGAWLEEQMPRVSQFNKVLFTVAIGLGVINIFRIYGGKAVKKERTWLESIVLLAAFCVTFAVGMLMMFGGKNGVLARELHERIFDNYIVRGLFMPLGSAMFSLLGFYMTRAAFRAFRVRNVEAALVMVSAVFIMLGALPVPVWEKVLPEALGFIRQWLLAGINTGVQRAVLIGSGIAWLVMAVRMWFSLDEMGQQRSAGGAG